MPMRPGIAQHSFVVLPKLLQVCSQLGELLLQVCSLRVLARTAALRSRAALGADNVRFHEASTCADIVNVIFALVYSHQDLLRRWVLHTSASVDVVDTVVTFVHSHNDLLWWVLHRVALVAPVTVTPVAVVLVAMAMTRLLPCTTEDVRFKTHTSALKRESHAVQREHDVGGDLIELVPVQCAVDVRSDADLGTLVPEACEITHWLLVDTDALDCARRQRDLSNLLLEGAVHGCHHGGELLEGGHVERNLAVDEPEVPALHVDDAVVHELRVRDDHGVTLQPHDLGVDEAHLSDNTADAALAVDLVALDKGPVEEDEAAGDDILHDVLRGEREGQATNPQRCERRDNCAQGHTDYGDPTDHRCNPNCSSQK
mmetsp:Transcript_33409/g.77579  ORF Transcript_33409/g.77579 Transcript_33409/m.77579 type:complete len:371 (-) Transcript_33409:558-1670(-)